MAYQMPRIVTEQGKSREHPGATILFIQKQENVSRWQESDVKVSPHAIHLVLTQNQLDVHTVSEIGDKSIGWAVACTKSDTMLKSVKEINNQYGTLFLLLPSPIDSINGSAFEEEIFNIDLQTTMPWSIPFKGTQKGPRPPPPPEQPGPGRLITAVVEALVTLLDAKITRSMVASVNVTQVTGLLMVSLFTADLTRELAKALVKNGNTIPLTSGASYNGAFAIPYNTMERLYPSPADAIKLDISMKKSRFEEIRLCLEEFYENLINSNDIEGTVVDHLLGIAAKKDDFVLYFKPDSPFPAILQDMSDLTFKGKPITVTLHKSNPSSFAQMAATPKKPKIEGHSKRPALSAAIQAANKLFDEEDSANSATDSQKSPTARAIVRASTIPRSPAAARKEPVPNESIIEKLQVLMLQQQEMANQQARKIDSLENSVTALMKAVAAQRNEPRSQEGGSEVKRLKANDDQSIDEAADAKMLEFNPLGNEHPHN